MKKFAVILAALLLSVYLTMLFSLTPAYVIAGINEIQRHIKIGSGRADGNLLKGYHFRDVVFSGRTGMELLAMDDLRIQVRMLPVLWGRVGFDVESREVTGSVSVTFRGSINGEIIFRDVMFKSASYIPEDNVSLAAPISGRAVFSGSRADMEFRSDDISWKRLAVSGFELPTSIFKKVRGAISVEAEKIIVKSLAFEGDKGYARLSGELAGSDRRLFMDMFPHDWNDPLLLPFPDKMISPGHYKMKIEL